MNRKGYTWEAWETALVIFCSKYPEYMAACVTLTGRSARACEAHLLRFNNRYRRLSAYISFVRNVFNTKAKISKELIQYLISNHGTNVDHFLIKNILYANFKKGEIPKITGFTEIAPQVAVTQPTQDRNAGVKMNNNLSTLSFAVDSKYNYFVLTNRAFYFYKNLPKLVGEAGSKLWNIELGTSAMVSTRFNNPFQIVTPLIENVVYKREDNVWLPLLEIDAKIWVFLNGSKVGTPLHFSHFEDNIAYAFVNGKTYFTAEKDIEGNLVSCATMPVEGWIRHE